MPKKNEPAAEFDPIAFMQQNGLNVAAGSDVESINGWIDTGNYALNWAVSSRFSRGWPLGRIVEIFGDNSTGKSFLVLRALAQAQLEGGFAFLDDTEAALTMSWAEQKLGVDPKKLAYVNPRSQTIKEHQDRMIAFIAAFKKLLEMQGGKHARPSVAALDSLGHLTTEYELENGTKDPKRPQDIHLFYRIIGSGIADLPVVYIVANHKIAAWGQFARDDSSGGQGTKYAASIRINLYSPTKLKNPTTGEFTGVIVSAYVEKNRLVQPWRTVKIAIPWDRPLNRYSGLVTMLMGRKILTAEGKNLVYREEDTGIPAAKSDFLKQDTNCLKLLEKFPNLLEELDAQFEQEEKQMGGDVVEDTADV